MGFSIQVSDTKRIAPDADQTSTAIRCYLSSFEMGRSLSSSFSKQDLKYFGVVGISWDAFPILIWNRDGQNYRKYIKTNTKLYCTGHLSEDSSTKYKAYADTSVKEFVKIKGEFASRYPESGR